MTSALAAAALTWRRTEERSSADYRGGSAVVEYDPFGEGPRSVWCWCLTLPHGGRLRGYSSARWHAEVLLTTLLGAIAEPRGRECTVTVYVERCGCCPKNCHSTRSTGGCEGCQCCKHCGESPDESSYAACLNDPGGFGGDEWGQDFDEEYWCCEQRMWDVHPSRRPTDGPAALDPSDDDGPCEPDRLREAR